MTPYIPVLDRKQQTSGRERHPSIGVPDKIRCGMARLRRRRDFFNSIVAFRNANHARELLLLTRQTQTNELSEIRRFALE